MVSGILWYRAIHGLLADEFRAFLSTNLEGFIFIAQLVVKQMLAQGTGGSERASRHR
jgi:hypothetical protein